MVPGPYDLRRLRASRLRRPRLAVLTSRAANPARIAPGFAGPGDCRLEGILPNFRPRPSWAVSFSMHVFSLVLLPRLTCLVGLALLPILAIATDDPAAAELTGLRADKADL